VSQRRLLEATLEHDIAAPDTPGHDIDEQDAAIWVRSGPPPQMDRSHRHDDLEINLVIRGQLDYLFGGRPLHVGAGEIAVFWGATPHRLIASPETTDVECRWVHIPLATVFSWGLPNGYLGDLVASRPVVLPVEAAGRDVESMFASWMSDLTDAEGQAFALLEIHALVRRLLRWNALHGADPYAASRPHGDSMPYVVEMARFATAHFRSDIQASDIARASHLNPNYAMTLFRETVGTTLGAYLTRCRVAEAQRLLLTTPMTTTEIAVAAGFGSQSSFYAHFGRISGTSPSAYRRSLR
jgi:AraC-like DNA-binding protein